MSSGSLFGEGIYTSRDFKVARSFGLSDGYGCGQVFVGLALPGNPNICTIHQDSGCQINQNQLVFGGQSHHVVNIKIKI